MLLLSGAIALSPGFSGSAFSAGFAGRKEKKIISKSVTGQVLDPSENGIDGATVTLKDLLTGKTLAVYTKDGGQYQFSDLKMNHDYELQAEHKGVKSETHQLSSIDTRTKLVVNFTIPPPTT